MAPHGKELTPDIKSLIVDLEKQGYSHGQISEILKIYSRTISKFLLRRKCTGDTENQR